MKRMRRSRPTADWQREHYFGKHTALVPARVGIEYVTGYGVATRPVRSDLSKSPQVKVRLGVEAEKRLSAGQRFVIWLNRE